MSFDINHWTSLTNIDTEQKVKPSVLPDPLTHGIATTYDESKQFVSTLNDEAARKDIIAAIEQLEQRGIDITADYGHWINIGFALAQLFGEDGRILFHRVSRMNTGYDYAEADRKYTNCLHKGSGAVGYQTVLHYAQQSGIDLRQIAHNRLCSMKERKPETDRTDILPSAISYTKNEKNGILGSFGNEMADGSMSVLAVNQSTGYTFSDKIAREDLPPFLWPIYDSNKDVVSRDKMLLGAITIISGILGGTNGTVDCRSGIYGIYDSKRVFAPLYVIVYGDAATSKGDLNACKMLARPIKLEMRRKYEHEMEVYKIAYAEWEEAGKGKGKSGRGPEPKEPEYLDPFLGADSSASAMKHDINANKGWGIIFDTEADTITNMLKSDYGNYSVDLRKAHHHESIKMNRTTDKVRIEIEEPRIGIMLTCTPGQLPGLFPSFENGLGSRFLFYALPSNAIKFRDVFAKRDFLLDDMYGKLGDELFPLFHALFERKEHPIQFVLTEQQKKAFLDTYQSTLTEQFYMLGSGVSSFIFRNALECFRIAMVLSALRCLSTWNKVDSIFDEADNAIVCTDTDYQTAMIIIGCLLNHTARVYAVMANDNDNPFKNINYKYKQVDLDIFKALPDGEFTTTVFIETAMSQGLSERQAYRKLGDYSSKLAIFTKIRNGVYRKNLKKEE